MGQLTPSGWRPHSLPSRHRARATWRAGTDAGPRVYSRRGSSRGPYCSEACLVMLMDVAPGQVLGRYELLMLIARGGMAMVWAARLKGSRGFQKLVAIKTMLP